MVRLAVIVMAGLGGCAAPLPTYPASTPPEAALAIIAERLESVKTLQSEAGLVLASPEGRSVRLDAAMVAQLPQRVRVRAWKFGAPVLDLTRRPDGTWLYLAEEAGADEAKRRQFESSVTGIGPVVGMLTGEFFRAATVVEATGTKLVAEGPGVGGRARCEIDRRTLTPRRFVFAGTEHEMTLGRYTMVGSVAWPMEIVFSSPSGRVTIRLHDPELNPELGERAFEPPARAQRAP